MAAVVGDTVMKYVSRFSGHEAVVIGGVPDTLHTRYTFSPEVQAAAEYLRERFEDYGLDVELQEFLVGNHHFLGGDFVDASHGWAVGTVVLRTVDGGLTWDGNNPGVAGGVLVDACRLDTLRGWVVGTDAQIFRSDDGGATWTSQFPPAGFGILLAVAFLDSLNGWVAGDGGLIARTYDGGDTWTQVPSGTASPIWGLHFHSANRGWACGDNGLVLTWDGSSWTVPDDRHHRDPLRHQVPGRPRGLGRWRQQGSARDHGRRFDLGDPPGSGFRRYLLLLGVVHEPRRRLGSRDVGGAATYQHGGRKLGIRATSAC